MIDNNWVNTDPNDDLFNNLYPNFDETCSSRYYTTENLHNSRGNDSTMDILINNVLRNFPTENLSSSNSNDFNSTLINYNIHSFNCNGPAFLAWLDCLPFTPNFLVLTESWNTADTVQLCYIPGYDAIHTHRDSVNTSRGGVGGGVSIFCTESLVPHKIEHLSFCTDTIESCVCRIDYDGDYLIILGIYRPHTDTVLNFLSVLECILSDDILINASVVLVAGDININIYDLTSREVEAYKNLMYSYSFIPVITRPTRFSYDNSSSSNLDHIWINKVSNFFSGIVLFDRTDHLPTFLRFNLDFNQVINDKIRVEFRPFSESNLTSLMNDMSSRCWDGFLQNFSSIDEYNLCSENFVETLDECYCKNFPTKVKFVSSKRLLNPWITPAIKKRINLKSVIFKDYKMGKISREHKNSLRNSINSEIRRAKNFYYSKLFADNRNNTRKKWGVLSGLMGSNSKKKAIDKIVVGGVEFANPTDIAEQFNNHFSSVGDKLASELPTSNRSPVEFLGSPTVNGFYLFSLTRYECEKLIKNLKITKTSINSMPVEIFKKVSHIVLDPLCNLINSSFRIGTFPNHLKIARITPVFKKGSKTDMNNYRPISSLHYISKIFERAMANKLTSFLDKFSILTPSQFGFRPGLCTTDALLRIIKSIHEALNDKKSIISIQLDLKKAFDVVDHGILLQKLSHYGVRGLPLQWFNSYLSDRHQFVAISHSISSSKPIKYGVPQGSILGPLLFLIFINDLPLVSSKFSSTLFADDSTFTMSSDNYMNDIGVINNELSEIYDWTISNRLTINVPKTELLCFSNLSIDISDQQIMLNDQFLKFSDVCTFLGIQIDNKLTFSYHINSVLSKLAKNTGILVRIKDCLTLDAKLNFYYAFLFPYLVYGVVVWGSTFDCYLQPIFIQQKRIVRMIAGVPPLEHTDPLFRRLKLLKSFDIYQFFMCVFMHPLYHRGQYSVTHNFNTRYSSLAQPLFQRLTMTQHSFDYCGPHIFNQLPESLKNIRKLSLFKTALKTYYLDRYIT